MNENYKNDYADTIEKFAKEVHELAEYIRANPDRMTLNKMQDVVLEILPLNIKFVEILKYRYPKIFKSVIKAKENKTGE